jgi:hypothetical protein
LADRRARLIDGVSDTSTRMTPEVVAGTGHGGFGQASCYVHTKQQDSKR